MSFSEEFRHMMTMSDSQLCIFNANQEPGRITNVYEPVTAGVKALFDKRTLKERQWTILSLAVTYLQDERTPLRRKAEEEFLEGIEKTLVNTDISDEHVQNFRDNVARALETQSSPPYHDHRTPWKWIMPPLEVWSLYQEDKVAGKQPRLGGGIVEAGQAYHPKVAKTANIHAVDRDAQGYGPIGVRHLEENR
jgi:hypothetical protein